jgi:hypothetical protein
VHDALGNPLTGEAGEFLDQVMVLDKDRASPSIPIFDELFSN